MKARGISAFLVVVLALFLSSCAVADKAARSYLGRNGATQETPSAIDQQSEPSANAKFIPADKRKKMKNVPGKSSSNKVAKESAEKEAPAKSKDSGRSGLIGWYMDMVDNSPLNPLRMPGSGGRLPQPVEDAMRMQGMVKDESQEEKGGVSAESNEPERSGLIGWYKDMVDKSPLNPLKMRKPE